MRTMQSGDGNIVAEKDTHGLNGIPVNDGPKFLYHVKQHMSNSQRYLVVGLVGLVGLGLPLTVTIRVSRISAMVSVRFSGIWDRRLQVCRLNEINISTYM